MAMYQNAHFGTSGYVNFQLTTVILIYLFLRYFLKSTIKC